MLLLDLITAPSTSLALVAAVVAMTPGFASVQARVVPDTKARAVRVRIADEAQAAAEVRTEWERAKSAGSPSIRRLTGPRAGGDALRP